MDLSRIREIIEDTGVGFLATCDDGQPRVRPMSFVLLEDGRLWSSTYRVSGKVDELERNPRVEVCFMDSKKVHLRVEGTLDTTGDVEKKRKLLELNPKVRRHFPDEHDAKFVHLEVAPTRIRWKVPGFNEYQEIPVD